MPTLSTWLAVLSITGNYGARALTPILAHVFCLGAGCDAVALVGSTAGAFFAGDLVAQVAAKALVQTFSGGTLLVAGTAGWGLLVLFMPLALPGPGFLLLPAQFALGFFCGLGYPSAHALLAETVPAALRTSAVTLVTSAAAFGTMASNFAIPQAVGVIGHKAPYAAFAIFGLLTSAVVLLRVPRQAPAISRQGGVAAGGAGEALQEVMVWMQDPLIAALVFGMYAAGVANAFLYSFVPTLFVQAYGADVAELGWLTMAAPLGNALCCVFSGLASDFLMARQWPTHRCRMLMQLIGTAVPVVSLLCLCACQCRTRAAAALTMWFACHGFQTSGLTAALHDVAHSRASELFAVGNMFCKFAGICAGPLIVQLSRSWGWGIVLGIISAHYAASGLAIVSLMPRVKESTKLFGHAPSSGSSSTGSESPKDEGSRSGLAQSRKVALSISVPKVEKEHKGLMESMRSGNLVAAAFGQDPGSPLSPVFHASPLGAECASLLAASPGRATRARLRRRSSKPPCFAASPMIAKRE